MCGFAGFMTQDSFDSSAAKSQLTKMCDAITHRSMMIMDIGQIQQKK